MAFIPAVPATISDLLEPDQDDDRSPLPAIHRIRASLLREGANILEIDFRKNEIRRFLLAEIDNDGEFCVDLKNSKKATRCNCMASITGMSEPTAVQVIDYLYAFALLTKAAQQTLVKEWIKYAKNIAMAYKHNDHRKRAVFLLPGATNLICKNALCRLLGMGLQAWQTIVTMTKKNLPPSHGLTGKAGNKVDKSMALVLSDFFNDILQLATPRATLVIRTLVREQVETELRDDDEEIVELPSHMTKRSLYDRLLFELGWKYTYDAKSRVIAKVALEGVEQHDPPSWTSFRRYWTKHHPKLFIAGAREDICNQCYVFANRHRYATRKKTPAEEEDEEETKSDEDDEDEQQQLGPPVGDGSDDEDDLEAMVQGEALILAAGRHVEMAQQQRSLYQLKRRTAVATADKRPSERVLCFVADYAQNMYIPNFASEQPGATYYFSPMSCYCFGVVDASKDQLSAWMYTEATAKKGGNNVASLLMHHLEHHGFVQQATEEPFKELNFIMDNCGGQNKNRHVLRLLHFIVKRRIAKKANTIFLVRGHTKNACDRLFNSMKKQYRKVNSFNPEDLLNSIKGNEKVDPFMVDDDVFKDWDKLEDVLVRKLPGGNTTKNHIFTVDIERNNGNSMFLQESDGSDEKEMKLVKPPYLQHDDAFWQQQQPTTIAPIGLVAIKWKELHHKWGPFVPQDKKEQWRYYTEAPPKALLKKVAKDSKRLREERKNRTRMIHDDKNKRPKMDLDNSIKEPDTGTGAI
jgi:hypothetical protein